jgi:hypothetical protein
MSSKTRKSAETIRHLTYFVVQAFKPVKGAHGKISADDPIEARDQDHAMALVARYKPIRAGVIAFRRTGDPTTGEWEDAVIIARHGLVGPEVDGLADESDLDFETGALTEVDLKVA